MTLIEAQEIAREPRRYRLSVVQRALRTLLAGGWFTSADNIMLYLRTRHLRSSEDRSVQAETECVAAECDALEAKIPY